MGGSRSSWWLRKLADGLVVFVLVFGVLELWGKDTKISLTGASAAAVGHFISILVFRKRAPDSPPERRVAADKHPQDPQ